MKVLGIGLSKTGTTSLGDALRILGLRIKTFPTSLSSIAYYDGAVDSPVAANFADIDHRYPGSRFIYTVRELQSWLDSCEAMWARRQVFFDRVGFSAGIHRTLYGTSTFDRQLFETAYHRHHARVQEFFRRRPSDLLTIDISQLARESSPWTPICNFLQLAVPDKPFPHSNSSRAINALIAYLAARLGDMHAILPITGVPQRILENIVSKVEPTALNLDSIGNDWETQLMLGNAIEFFGGITQASAATGIPQNTIESATRGWEP